jgi:transposase-like protein
MTCQNPACAFFLIEEGKDLVKNGRNSAGNQQYFCKHCQTYFTETKNTPFYRSRLKLPEVDQLCRLSQETISMRGVSRVTGHHQATIARYYRLVGEHAAFLTATFLQDLGHDRVEMDEFWAFVQKKANIAKGSKTDTGEIGGPIRLSGVLRSC